VNVHLTDEAQTDLGFTVPSAILYIFYKTKRFIQNNYRWSLFQKKLPTKKYNLECEYTCEHIMHYVILSTVYP
jgi:hypothetical protein